MITPSAALGLLIMIETVWFPMPRLDSWLPIKALGRMTAIDQSLGTLLFKWRWPGGAEIPGTQSAESGLPAPWQTRDIGPVKMAGGATYANDAFMIMGGGWDIWGTADQFRYVYQIASGDCEIHARVVSVQNTDLWAKAGVMIRQALSPGSPHAMIVVTPTAESGVAFQHRGGAGTVSANAQVAGVSAPYWVRMTRSGNTFTAYRSAEGTVWTSMGSVTIPMPESVYIGMAVTSHTDRILCTTTIDNVSVTP
ncbi:MAG TPA: hypothetical protein VJ302_13490 [Blastocatellia bacterium]|nr:hypothetical protein [Blastocatellia bacterium]